MPIEIDTEDATAVVDITDQVNAQVPDDLDVGLCCIHVAHTTAGVTINENEPRIRNDLAEILDRLVPTTTTYAHDDIDDNAAAHLRSVLLGASTTVPVRDGDLALGTWQSVLFVESDGPRRRSISVTTTEAFDPPQA